MFKTAITRLLAQLHLGRIHSKKIYACPVCGKQPVAMAPLSPFYFSKWREHQFVHNPLLFETLNWELYSCTHCGATDRDRLYALYLSRIQGQVAAPFRMLDIAPSGPLARFIKALPGVEYRTMDLAMKGVDDIGDITHMHVYENNRFNFFICSHVLEHVADDGRAMQELYRILKPGGSGIAMVPINLGVETTLEDASYTSEAERWKYFGQQDHLRMYAKKDFISRLEAAGFTVLQLGSVFFGAATFSKNAIDKGSVLYIVQKPG